MCTLYVCTCARQPHALMPRQALTLRVLECMLCTVCLYTREADHASSDLAVDAPAGDAMLHHSWLCYASWRCKPCPKEHVSEDTSKHLNAGQQMRGGSRQMLPVRPYVQQQHMQGNVTAVLRLIQCTTEVRGRSQGRARRWGA